MAKRKKKRIRLSEQADEERQKETSDRIIKTANDWASRYEEVVQMLSRLLERDRYHVGELIIYRIMNRNEPLVYKLEEIDTLYGALDTAQDIAAKRDVPYDEKLGKVADKIIKMIF